MYETTLECSGERFQIDSLTSDQTRAFEAKERENRAKLKAGEDPDDSLMDCLLGMAYPDHDFGPMKHRDKVQVFQATHAYTYGAPVPEGNSSRSGSPEGAPQAE